jgi:thiamine-monophosphate kinase
VDEFAVIERLRALFEAVAGGGAAGRAVPPRGDTWIGDDAAAVTFDASRRALLCTDLVVEGVHVDLRLSSIEDVGFKALMVTVSDLAAMGGRAEYALVSVAAPPGTDLDGLGVGVAEAAARAGCRVVGGDLSKSPVLVVSIAAFGSLRGPPDAAPLLRSGAAAGDLLFVTGPLGGSAAGLRLLQAGGPLDGVSPGLAAAHRRPVARLEEGETARLSGATAAIDISDGLVSDARHLADASGVGIALDAVPVQEGASREEALHGGEDYELLLATGDPVRLAYAFEAAGLRTPLPVGRCTDRPGERTLDGLPWPPGGWLHRF